MSRHLDLCFFLKVPFFKGPEPYLSEFLNFSTENATFSVYLRGRQIKKKLTSNPYHDLIVSKGLSSINYIQS